MVMDDLEQIVLCVLEDHEYALVLEDDLLQLDDIGMGELSTECHLPDGRLRETSVLDRFAFLVGLEPGQKLALTRSQRARSKTNFLIANSPFCPFLPTAL